MKKKDAKPATVPAERIAELVRTIHEAEMELQQLTAGQLDTINSVRTSGACQDIAGRKNAAAAALQSSLEEFRNLAEAMPQIVWITRADGWAVYFNRHWMDYTGLMLEESLGQNWIKPFHPDDQQRAWNAWQHATATVEKYSIECRLRRADGEYRWWLIRGEPQRDAAGVVQKWFGTCTDVHDLKLADLRLSRTNRALKLLSGCNEALIRAVSMRDLLSAVCQMAVDAGGYRMAWVGYAQDDADCTIMPVAQAGTDDGYLSEVKLSWNEKHPGGRGPAGECIRAGQAVVCEDMEKNESFINWRKSARTRGYRGLICLPLIEAGRIFGLLGLYTAEVIEQNDEELKLLQELADDLAFGIGHLRTILEQDANNSKVREQAALLDSAHEAIFVKDMEDRIIYWNKGAERIYGWTSEEALGQTCSELLHFYPDRYQEAQTILMAKGEWNGEMVKRTKSGRKIILDVSWTLVRDDAGKPRSILAINSDITDQKKLEEQFLRAQRMESIGTLAGGIAHDLNNALAPILMGVAVLELEEMNPELKDVIKTIKLSAQHGTELVKQVLTFSRGMEGQRMRVNVATVVKELVKVTKDTLPKNTEVELNVATDLWIVTADPTQIHQVVINLFVNARDAMPNGGKITIELENQVLDEIYAQMNPQSTAGAFVTITVTDTGEGIPPELQDRIFDPFFTTKQVGKGTGLGLSTVLGIVKGHGGFINLYSEKGRGSSFKVYLPANVGEAEKEAAADEQTKLPRGHGELILVVDDEESVRNIVKRALERFGYQVALANNGAEAVSLYAKLGKKITVVLTDMSMPIMDGPTTIIALKTMDPDVVIVGSSGLDTNGNLAKAAGAGVTHFVPKPYSAEEILRVLAEAVLESEAKK
jgi:PAS domain S-box-containing protein